jgi:hypothetical protein
MAPGDARFAGLATDVPPRHASAAGRLEDGRCPDIRRHLVPPWHTPAKREPPIARRELLRLRCVPHQHTDDWARLDVSTP